MTHNDYYAPSAHCIAIMKRVKSMIITHNMVFIYPVIKTILYIDTMGCMRLRLNYRNLNQ